MPSDRVYMCHRGQMHTKGTSSGGMLLGGAVAQLRNVVVKNPIDGSGLLGANQIVGIKSPAPPKKSTDMTQAQRKPTVFQGGELLNRIAFEPYMKKGRENIKFLF